MTGTAGYTRPNNTTQDASTYKASIDAMAKVFERFGDWFAPHQQDVGSPAPDLSIRLDAGHIWDGTTLTEIAAQTVSGFTTPGAGQNRVDRVVVDEITGAASRVAGAAVTGSPTAVAPSIPAGKIPVCQVLITSADTVITNDMITDERPKTAPRLQSKMITLTRNLATGSGSVSYTGVGFKPSSMIVFGANGSTNACYLGNCDSALGQYSMFQGASSDSPDVNAFFIRVGPGADNQTAQVTSFDADGFTLAWTRNGAPGGTVTFSVLCFR